jgi:tRNA nucleotidyltransferase (CCA-adding enzyme)
VAMERVSAEWDKMMAGSGPEQACHYLFKSELLLNLKEPLPSAFQAAAERYRFNELLWEWEMMFTGVVSEDNHLLGLPLISETDLRWSALVIGLGIGEQDGLELCRTLRFSGRRTARIAAVVGMSERLSAFEEHSDTYVEEWIRMVLNYGRPIAEDWLALHEASKGMRLEERDWLEGMPVCSVQELNVRGDELARLLDRSSGPWIAELLRRLLEEVALGNLSNDKESLLEAANSSGSVKDGWSNSNSYRKGNDDG